MIQRIQQLVCWWPCLIGAAILFFLPFQAAAQLAPVMGTHYAARASDTGFAGAVNSQGGYGASVPLDLPPAKGGLPVPLSVVYGGRHFGAAGLGWDVPLSYIYHSKTIAHHRPKPAPFSVDVPTPINSPDLLILMLLGERIELVRNAVNTAWVGRQGSEQLEVRDRGNGAMVGYDGNGLTYTFSAQGGCAGCRLDNGNLFMLVSIVGPGGKSVQLVYRFGTPVLPGGGTGLSIDLTNVRYNKKPTGNCFKDDIALAYDAPSATPLSMSMLGSTVLTRVHKLTAINLTRAGNSSDPAVCAAAPQSLRKYTFTYQADPDTGQPRLQNVTMIGQQGTPEHNVTLPVASYSYGKVTGTDGKITYQKTQSITLPRLTPPVITFGLSYTSAFLINTIDHLVGLISPQNFVDFDGDGRPDLSSEVGVFKNIPGDNGTTAFVSPSDSGLSSFGADETTTTDHAPRFGGTTQPDGRLLNRVEVWKRHIDMNGDGRLDFVDAQTDPSRWILHINAPDPIDSSKSIDIVRTISTAPIRQAIKHRYFRLDDSKPIPLARITSVQDTTLDACWLWEGDRWTTANPTTCPNFPPNTKKPEKTITEWELKDINGDGYPDFVYTESPVRYNDFFPQDRPNSPGTVVGQTTIIRTPVDLFVSNNVMAMINTIGVHLANGDDYAFASPVLLANDGCGVARWRVAPGAASASELSQTCGFEDINGDGLVDRVTSVYNNLFISTAALGTGNADHPFSTGATITLPGPLARNSTALISQPDGHYEPASCVSGQTHYDTQRTAGLHDINGDGIPDYITSVDTSVGRLWRIQLGTGTGFASQVSVTSPVGLELSLERNTCTSADVVMPGDGTTRTPIGLYDLDGDGQPEVVSMPATNALHWDVYQLTSPDPISWIGHTSLSVPSAGRLVAIDNGYGAITRIDYLSAKENGTTRHNLPYPEIVVAAEGVTDSANHLLSAVTTYAYGGAELIFDSAEDRFIFPGYQRMVSKVTTDEATVNGDGIATITDTYSLVPFEPTLDAQSRFSMYRQVGRVRDITRLSGFLDNDPWGLLAINIATDSRRIALSHYSWFARLLPSGPAPATNEQCVEMIYPYDFARSLANQLPSDNDECVKHGFAFETSVFAYRGTPGTVDMSQSTHVVRSASVLEGIDDLGRATSVRNNNDLMRSDDDACIQITYATPSGTDARVLNAPASRTMTDCSTQPKTLARESWEYDGKKSTSTDPTVRVSNGFVTSHIVSRIDLDSFTSLGDIRDFETTYDSIGNPLTVTKARDDGAIQKATVTYDAFGLVPMTVKTEATNADGTKLPQQQAIFLRDPITLQLTTATDANGMKQIYQYDGLNRLTQTLVTPPTGPAGVLSTTNYNGFAVGSTTDRHIVRKVFTDPVAPANVNTAPGRIATVFFDSLGRQTRTEAQLGADYANKKLFVGQRIYDSFGRVHFEADPFPATEILSTAYGTTYYFFVDGTLQCAIRGNGPQPPTLRPNEANEIYPTCFDHTFENNQELVSSRDAASLLLTSPQAKVVNASVHTAIGRLIEQSTRLQLGAVLERAAFSYDALGHMTSMTRYQNPGTPSGGVTTRWHHDSLGWMSRLEEPDIAPQTRTFDSWGQIIQIQWCDDKTPEPCPTSDRRSIMRYDAFGRLIHGEDRLNNTTIAETVHDLTYDAGVNNATPVVTATNVIGRLAKAASPTSAVSFSYDPFGRVNAAVFTDRTVSSNNVYVQKHDYHGDGSLQTLHLLLPDNAFKNERVDYAYDSAGRTRSITYSDGPINKALFTATGSTDLDIFGRTRRAQYGLATYTADYAETGRRLIHHFQVNSPSPQTTSRQIAFPATPATEAATAAFDPVGRERVRRETKDGVPGMIRLNQYDALGQLVASLHFDESAQTSMVLRSFTYDSIGNIRTQVDSTAGNPGSVTLSYQTIDPDRICSIGYGPTPPATACDVKYDGAGNMLEEPTHAGSKRLLSYFPNGQVRTVTRGDSQATFDYDAFGAVQRLVLTSTSSPDTRNDKHFGSLIYRRDELVGGTRRSIITRSIPGPGGLIATRHGPNAADPWTFSFGEGRGNRFVTDETGAFVQDIDYQPYGEATVAGAQPVSQKYVNAQWNGGDALQALGLVQLGARFYDPAVGRFLSRDPVFDPGNLNAYAFAGNDPVNISDPTGLQGEVDPTGTPPGCHPGVCGSSGPGNPGGFGRLGHWIKCWFTDCGPSKPEPHTSTTTSAGPIRHNPKPQEPHTSTTGVSGEDRRPPWDQIGPPWATYPTLADNPLFTQLEDSDIYRLSPMGRELFGSFLETQYGARPNFDRTFFRVGSIENPIAVAVTDHLNNSGGFNSVITLDKIRFWRVGTSLSKMGKIAHELVHVLQKEKLGLHDMEVRNEGERRVWSRDAIDVIPDWAHSLRNVRSLLWVVNPTLTLEQNAEIGEYRFYMEQQIRAGNINFTWK